MICFRFVSKEWSVLSNSVDISGTVALVGFCIIMYN